MGYPWVPFGLHSGLILLLFSPTEFCKKLYQVPIGSYLTKVISLFWIGIIILQQRVGAY